jgi:aminoglycoside phosphotransferase (APT) family kinase protein
VTDPASPQRLSAYLESALPQYSGAFSIERVGEGNSCLTYLVTGEDGWRFVLRRPPRGDLPRSAYDVAREFRVMSALRESGSGVPVPAPIALCEDIEVLGAPFYLMETVDGLVLRTEPPEGLSERDRQAAAESLIDTLVLLHGVDWRAAGLDDFGNPSGYAERQLGRMTRIWEKAKFRPLPDVDAAGEWLQKNIPPDASPSIVHGDYRLDNVILAPVPRVGAVLDWELSTIGDPAADLGWLLYYWLDDAAEREWPGMPAPMIAPGFPRREEVRARYLAARPGVSPERVTWYAVLAGWKTAVMLEGTYRRFVEGGGDHPSARALEDGIPYLARRAHAIAEGSLRI